MTNSTQSTSGARKSMLIGIAEPLYMQDYEMRARKHQAEVVAKAFCSLAHSLSRAVGNLVTRAQIRLKSASKKRHQPSLDSVGSS